MLASGARLSSARDIARVYTRGKYANEGPLALKFAKAGSASRCVIVVSKKVSKRATVRNKIRRRLSAILAERWATVETGYDIVIMVREDVSEASLSDLTTALVGVLTKARIVKATNEPSI